MAVGNYPPIGLLSQVFEYKDGSLYWKERRLEYFKREKDWKTWNTKNAGNEAGCPGFYKYRNCWRWQVKLSGKKIPRSVLVWALHHQKWPIFEVDHKDRNTENDKIENLRPATGSQQGANTTKRSNNTSGYKGVSWSHRDSRWLATIMVNGKSICLGRHKTKEEAHAAYCKAAIAHFKDFACFG